MLFEGALIKGQDSASLFPSYLFAGPDGAAKILAAKNFAKAINCLSEGEKPCGQCVSCRKIDSGTHPDVFFVEPKGASFSTGIDRIREVITRANLKPYEAKVKVFIIENAHSMNVASGNALLKTLEEPPENTVFILISRSENELLPTIVSRCHIIRFFAPGPGVKEDDLIKEKNNLLDSLPDKINFTKELESYANKEELKKKIEFLISYFRDIFLYKAVKDKAPFFHADRIDKIKKECANFTQDRLEFLIKKMITLCSYIDYNVNPKLIVAIVAEEASCTK